MVKETVAGRPDPEVALKLLENVDQAWRRLDSRLHREAQAVRLAGPVIGILAENDDPHLVKRRQVERPEPFGALGENAFAALTLGEQEAFEVGHVGLGELALQGLQPARMKTDLLGRHSPPL